MRFSRFAALCGAMSILAAPAVAAPAVAAPALATPGAASDPYAPLRLYDGAWKVASSDGKTLDLVNRCSRAGTFFTCEQALDGKPTALVVFQPVANKNGVLTYRNRALRADGGAGNGGWGGLTIDGDDWVYLSGDGAERSRVLNHFTGRDRIHFEVQSSTDGKTWRTTLSGEETRVR